MSKFLFTLISCFILISTNSYASHYLSITIEAQHISGNSYNLVVHLMRDCGLPIWPSIGINGNSYYSLKRRYSSYSKAINSTCIADSSLSTCFGGTNKGYIYTKYSDTVSLPSNSQIMFYYDSCCRATSTNLVGQPGVYYQTILNTSNQNSTPTFPYFNNIILHANTASTFDLSANDIDGDSLVYSFTSAKTGSTTNAPYNPGHSATQPMPGLSLSSQGILSYNGTSTIGGFYYVNYKVEEYDPSSGLLKGSIEKEIFIGVQNNPNLVVNNQIIKNGIISSSGGNLIGDSLFMCKGDSFDFDVSFTSPNGLAQVSSIDSSDISFSTATSHTGNNTNVKFFTNPNIPSGTHIISVVMEDTACAYSSLDYYSFTLIVEEAISIPNNSYLICPGDSIILDASNNAASNYKWAPSTGLSCSNCPITAASPSNNTTYIVTAALNSPNCSNTDTITVLIDSLGSVTGRAVNSMGVDYSLEQVLLIEYDPSDSTVTILDSTLTDTTGFFTFNIPTTEAYIKIVPDSATYPNEIPTYWSQSAFFLNADSIQIAPCSNFFDTLVTLAGVNPGGPGFVSGNVYKGAGKKEGVGDPVHNVDFLLKNDQGEIVQHWKSDGNGRIQFSNIPFGEYFVYVDLPWIKNDLPPKIIVNQHTNQNTYDFTLNSKKLVRVNPNSIEQPWKSAITVYPNPAHSQLFVKGINTASYQIISIQGQLIKEGLIENEGQPIRISNLQPGSYLLQIESNQGRQILRFVKNK